MAAQSVSQELLLDYLREVGPQEVAEIALTTDIHEATARRKLESLVRQGKVASEFAPKGGSRVYRSAQEAPTTN